MDLGRSPAEEIAGITGTHCAWRGDAELIVDALESFDASLLLNRAANEREIPLFHGAISGFRGLGGRQ
ncbi:MAG: hypothetical protein JW986_09875 [Methanotrichaceae archaeon]|nr:hypothetical protein [Methanotrichaceae archaeon]